MKWRTGFARATGPERMVLLQAEQVARERAFGEWYQERCEAVGSVLVDAHDLAPRSVRVEWCRSKGYLLIRLTVYNRSARGVRHYHWRKALRRPIGRAEPS